MLAQTQSAMAKEVLAVEAWLSARAIHEFLQDDT